MNSSSAAASISLTVASSANTTTCADVTLSGDPAMDAAASRMGVAWNVGNSVAAFATPKKTTAATSSGATSNAQLHLVSWETSLYSPVMRKLVNESAQVFLALQKAEAADDSAGGAHLARISRQYRSVMRDCQQQLDAEAELAEDSQTAEELVRQSELLYKLELIWNLVEIICIEKPANGLVLPQMLQWISLHFPRPEELTRDLLSEHPDNPEVSPDYWDAIALYALQGRTDQAQKLLRLHSDFDSESFVSLDELLRKMPLYPVTTSVSGGGAPATSAVDFEFRWKHWQREVAARIDEGDFVADENLARIAAMLAGDDEVFGGELVDKCESWYQWMTGRLLFTQPDVKKYDLSLAAELAINKFGGLSRMTSLDSVLLAVMESDLAQVLHELCTTLDNFWFPAHLLDLLYHADQIDHLGHHVPSGGDGEQRTATTSAEAQQPGPGLREFLLLDYATCLMSHNSLWQLGVLYLDHCSVQGLYRLELLLERVPLESERKANKVIGLAADRGLTSVVTQTCKVMGMRSLRSGRIGAAMSWAIRSQDVTFTTFLADRLLLEYTTSGSFSSTDLLDHLGSSMVLSDRLTFLAKYREFHKLCEQGAFRTAAGLLHSLMWSRLAPKYFWVTLLIDALPFISSRGAEVGENQAMLNSEQTYELMHCLQELVKDEALPKNQRLLLNQHEQQIRMELARNLAVALMDEGEEEEATI